MAEFRAATAEQQAFLGDLLDAGLLIASGVPGVYGRVERRSRTCAAPSTRPSRGSVPTTAPSGCAFRRSCPGRQFEDSGYLKSFPHLAGTIFDFDGSEAEALEQQDRASRHEDWSEFQTMSDLVLVPAACYPVYPAIAARGPLAPGGRDRRRRRLLRASAASPPATRRGCRCSTSARSSASASPRRSPTGARCGATARSSCCAGSGSTPTSTSPPTRSSAAAGG